MTRRVLIVGGPVDSDVKFSTRSISRAGLVHNLTWQVGRFLDQNAAAARRLRELTCRSLAIPQPISLSLTISF